ncbi:MAG TPA: ChbG/HpnK family deacetylase [Pilimelia sp.]|nr:ChbG/HpnK family deacetylase [Pilimelia sp.]
MDKLLIVNADDYGLTEAIARGILRAHREGVVTSTSVLAVGPALGRTARWLADHPRLATGAHLALVGEDPPLLTRREIPTLVTRTGGFPHTWQGFLARAAAGRVDPADVEREFTAQLERLTRDHGLRLTHVDTHQHLHLWPPVAAAVIAAARRWQIGAVRLPSSRDRGPKGHGIRWLKRRLAARIRAAGLVSPGDYGGLDEAGRLTLPRFITTLDRLAATGAASVEINCHPGEADDPARARYAWDYQWDGELAALTSRELREAIGRHGFRTGGHAELSRQ